MKVLVIDDEPDIRKYLTTLLEDEGYEAFSMDENDDFNDIITTLKPNLILLDIMMPKRSGISVYKELRSKNEFKDIPIVIITGMTPAKDFKEEGFKKIVNDDSIRLPDGFIEKPIQVAALHKLVNNILKKD